MQRIVARSRGLQWGCTPAQHHQSCSSLVVEPSETRAAKFTSRLSSRRSFSRSGLSPSPASTSSSSSTAANNANSHDNKHVVNRRLYDALSRKISPNAKHYNLEDRPTVRFTVRPAPSVVPPTMPFPPSSSTDDPLPPALKNDGERASSTLTPLTPAQVEEMRQLRTSDPIRWTRSRLAKKFNCSPFFVGIVGFADKISSSSSSSSAGSTTTTTSSTVPSSPLQGSRKSIADAVKQRHLLRQEAQRERWGFKKRVDREVRRRRKEFW